MPVSAIQVRGGSFASGGLVLVGQAPAVAMAMTDVAMADSIGLALQNAVAQQQRMQTVSTAVMSKVLVQILEKGNSS